MRLPALSLIVVLASSCAATAAETLPILAGHYATGACTPSGPFTTRDFEPGSTSTSNEDCSIVIKTVNGKVYRAHLACRYKQASNAEDDVVLRVDSPRSVTWIDQCLAVTYRFCGPRSHGP